MKEFRFTQDVKCEFWFRRNVVVTAESHEKAKEIILKYKNEELNDNEDYENLKIDSTEWLSDTASDVMDPEENNASIEITDPLDQFSDPIADNTPLRVFNKFERVFNCTYEPGTHGWGVVMHHTIIENEDTMVLFTLDETGQEFTVRGTQLYRLAKEHTRCPRCGRILCDEHNKEDLQHNYRFYCPECDENFI